MNKIEYPIISDSDIPSGSGRINQERYTYGQLRHQPIIPEVMAHITNPTFLRWAQECNERNRSGFVMRKVEGEYSFDSLRVGPKVRLPTRQELIRLLGPKLNSHEIRVISYEMLREELALQTGMSIANVALAIGNQFDCVPHEDVTGYVYMVPNWAHRWFRHKGYVSAMMS